MPRRSHLPAIALSALIAAGPAAAQPVETPFPARLAGHAILPALSPIDPPADAPDDARLSGKFTGPENRRIDTPGTRPGTTGRGEGTRPTGVTLPMAGQPLQGLSSLRSDGAGGFFALSDNGFGSKANSADSLLAVHRLRPDWSSGTVARIGTIWLRDPDRKFPWPIRYDGTAERYLTGADLDPESLALTPDGFWIGDEFGPFLLRFDASGRLVSVVEAAVDGKGLRSPDHPAVQTPTAPDRRVEFQVERSRGFEGLAASPDGRFLYALLEGPVWSADRSETFADGKPRLRLLEFDTVTEGWTGRSWTYALAAEGHAIGEITLLDPDRALIVERDHGEGEASLACPSGQPAPTCFDRPAKFKRLVMVSKAGVPAGGALRKVAHLDLLQIADPEGVARQGARADGRFAFPFVTIEAVEPVSDGRLVLVNDNNLPFSAGRFLDRADDSEFILLDSAEFLAKDGGDR